MRELVCARKRGLMLDCQTATGAPPQDQIRPPIQNLTSPTVTTTSLLTISCLYHVVQLWLGTSDLCLLCLCTIPVLVYVSGSVAKIAACTMLRVELTFMDRSAAQSAMALASLVTLIFSTWRPHEDSVPKNGIYRSTSKPFAPRPSLGPTSDAIAASRQALY